MATDLLGEGLEENLPYLCVALLHFLSVNQLIFGNGVTVTLHYSYGS